MSSTVIARRSVSTQRRPRSVCSALLTPSREEPTQLASSSWVIGRSMRTPPPGCSLPVVGRELDEPGGDAADRVRCAELRALAVGLAQAGDEPREDPERRARRALEERAEVGGRDHERLDRVDRGHARGARLAVDRRQLAEQVARPAEREHGLAAVLGRRGHLHPPGGAASRGRTPGARGTAPRRAGTSASPRRCAGATPRRASATRGRMRRRQTRS